MITEPKSAAEWNAMIFTMQRFAGDPAEQAELALNVLMARYAVRWPDANALGQWTNHRARFLAWLMISGGGPELNKELDLSKARFDAKGTMPGAPLTGQLWYALDATDGAEGGFLVVRDVETAFGDVILQEPNALGMRAIAWDDLSGVNGPEMQEHPMTFVCLGEAPPELRDGYDPPHPELAPFPS